MKIETLIPGFESIKYRVKNNTSLCFLILMYDNFYKEHAKKSAIEVFTDMRSINRNMRKSYPNNPESFLDSLDKIRILGFILINSPIKELENLYFALEKEYEDSEKISTQRKISLEMGLLEGYIIRAKEYKRKK